MDPINGQERCSRHDRVYSAGIDSSPPQMAEMRSEDASDLLTA